MGQGRRGGEGDDGAQAPVSPPHDWQRLGGESWLTAPVFLCRYCGTVWCQGEDEPDNGCERNLLHEKMRRGR